MSQLNLRTILAGDNISAVVEKINYNFQQIVLNGGGPQGIQGLLGGPGIPGPIGPYGPTGSTGATGTYVYAGATAPNSMDSSNLVPPGRLYDIYIQPDSGSGMIYFWEKGATGATGWDLVGSVSASDGIFTTAEPVSFPEVSNTAAYSRLNKASLLLVSDFDSMGLTNHILTNNRTQIHGWLDQGYGTWQSMFGGQSGQIRILNTDPAISGPSASSTRNTNGAGMLLSLSTVAGTSDQVFYIESADDSNYTNDKFFYLSANKGSTASIFTDGNNQVAVYTTKDANDTNNRNLQDSLTVFGSELVYDPSNAKLRISTADSSSNYSRFYISKAPGLTGTASGEWEFRLGNSSDANDHSLRIFGTQGSRNGQIFSFGVASLDDRSVYTPAVRVGRDTLPTEGPIAEFEVGSHVAGRLGLGQISPASGNDYGAGYQSFNVFRGRGDYSAAVWSLKGDGTYNGGAINWSSADGKTMSFLLMPSTGGSTRTYTGDSFLLNQSSITMKRIGSSSTKLFIDSYAYTELGDSAVTNAPHLVIGLGTTSSPALFNFGNATEGIGLHGITKGIEWLTSQAGSKSSGFRFIPGTGSNGSDLSTLSLQYHSYNDTDWRNVMTIISQDNAVAGTHSGNILVGDAVPSSTLGNAKFTVVGATLPANGATVAPNLGGPQIVDFRTAGGTSMFTLDRDGNVVAGVRFGNSYYDSSDAFTLDHYEEGTWTPLLMPEGGTATYTSWNTGLYKIYKSNYTRIGDRVKVDFTIKIDGLTAAIPGSTGSSMYISGFPFRPDFERVVGSGATVSDPLNPCYPFVPLKTMGISDAGGAAFGQIAAYAGGGNNVPTGWKLCNGQSLSKTLYPELFAVIGTTYGSDDSSTFKVPDLRGYFVRGLNELASTNPDVYRTLGSLQQDEFEAHRHYGMGEKWTTWPLGYTGGNANPGNGGGLDNDNYFYYGSTAGGSETRPVNVAMNYIIYAGGGVSNGAIGDLSGGFVLYNGTKTRLYLYDSLSTLEINNLPGGSGVSSMLFGSFEYFVSIYKSVPLITGRSFDVTIGDTSFSIPLSDYISSESSLTSVTVSGLPAWMTFNSSTYTLEFASGYTSIPGPTASNSLVLTASNSSGSGSGSFSVNVYTIAPPVVYGPSGVVQHVVGDTDLIGYTATNSPTVWGANWGGVCTPGSFNLPAGTTFSYSGSGATLTIGATYSELGLETFIVCASNVSGTGSTSTEVNTTLVHDKVLNWSFNSYITGWTSGYGNATINVYDDLTGGNLVATVGVADLQNGNSTGTFTDLGLVDGDIFYAEVTGFCYGLGTGLIVPSSIGETPGGDSTALTITNGSYTTFSNSGSRIQFVYDENTPNTVYFNLYGF